MAKNTPKSLVTEDFKVGLDGGVKAHIDGIGDQGVADGDFEDVGDTRTKSTEILQAEVVSSVDTETKIVSALGRRGVGFKLSAHRGLPKRSRVRLGVKLDAIDAKGRSAFDLLDIRVHKKADAHPLFAKEMDDRFEAFAGGTQIPTVIGSRGVGIIRNQRALGRTKGANQIEPRGALVRLGVNKRVSFDIELDVRVVLKKLMQIKSIRTSDMPLIRARMNGDAVSACGDTGFRSAQNVRDIERSRVSQECDLVQVHAELGHGDLLGVGGKKQAPARQGGQSETIASACLEGTPSKATTQHQRRDIL